MAMDLKSMAVTMPEVAGHPNRAAFRGVLTMVDVPSERAPSGAKGHRVILTKKAAEAALPSLLGMGVDYSPALDRHDVRRKVGIITRAEIVGRSIELGGYLFARDFPEIVEEIARSEGLRCNHELASRRPRRDNGLAAKGSSCQPVLRGGHKELRSALRNVAAQLLSLTESLQQRQAARGKPANDTCGDPHGDGRQGTRNVV